MHDTPFSELPFAPAGLAVGCTIQLEPFHRSANVDWILSLCKGTHPTAMQSVSDMQDTAARCPIGRRGVGAGSICQLEAAAQPTDARMSRPPEIAPLCAGRKCTPLRVLRRLKSGPSWGCGGFSWSRARRARGSEMPPARRPGRGQFSAGVTRPRSRSLRR